MRGPLNEVMFFVKEHVSEFPDSYIAEDLAGAEAELADLRARALPAEIVDAVRVYQEAFLRWSSDCMNVDNVFILEKVKEELMRRIEADAKGGG